LRSEQDDQFQALVAARRAELVRTATLLTAGDPHLAEDLVQATLTKVYVSWAAFQRADNPGGYLYRCLVNAMTDEHRRPWRRRERPMASLPDRAAGAPDLGERGDRLARALKDLPARMRAAVVFRYFHGFDVAETAAALGCSQGTVKSQTARALDRLRATLDDPAPDRDSFPMTMPALRSL
jgi:RNA polymerase sigma-70 factor (sigma-E family)